MSDHRRLEVWKRLKELARRVYFVVMALPRADQHRLGDQLIRSSNSVPNNIAEGANSGSDAKYLSHVDTAMGSANELHDQLTGLDDIGLLRDCDRDLLEEAPQIGPMLEGLAKTIIRRMPQFPKRKARRKPRPPIP